MDTVRLAYRDNDRTPVIYCIKEMAARHYDIDVQVVRIQGLEYESAPFDGACDMICEHQEYLYEEVSQGRQKATMFLAPVREPEGQLVVGPGVNELTDLKGKRLAVRTSGRPFSIALRVRAMGLEGSLELVPVADAEVGRWRQWEKITSGDCAAAFISRLYLPAALAAGLRVLPSPSFDVVAHYAHACSTAYAREHDDVMLRYTRAVVHAICLMKLRRQEALEIVAQEPARLMKLDQDRLELERQFDCIVSSLELRPYPTPAAIANTYEIACDEWKGSVGINPLTLWDLHWLKQVDDEGFIDALIDQMKS